MTRPWTSRLFGRVTCTRTSWPLRLVVLVLVVVTVWLTSGWWSRTIARDLACTDDESPTQAIVLENLEPFYEVFERAELLGRADRGTRPVFVPVWANASDGSPNGIDLGIAELMARIARVGRFEVIPIPKVEPLSLNTAYGVRDFLAKRGISSVTVVAPPFRSRRSALVYNATLAPAGITVRCVSARGARFAGEWTATWHGMQRVVEEWAKLQYYRFWVLPFAK